MGRRKINKQRRPRPQKPDLDQAGQYADRNRKALCRTCGGELSHLRHSRPGAAPEIVVAHSDSDRDADHVPDRVWVWDEVQCDFCGGHGVVWSYQVVPLAAARPLWLTQQNQIVDHSGSMNETPWTACEGCANLIELEDWRGLVRAFVTRHEHESGQIIDAAGVETIRELQSQFVSMRTGGRLPYGTST
ncbi:hypothetical protein [Streptomyces nigrescens]|uniref:hypothetical protein n=1 Tax=Streptomyces nigrescens TaxID=1920 RepID=UPI0036FC2DBF